MSTQAVTPGTVLIVEDSDTYISNAQTSPETAAFPAINDGSGTTVAVGTEIRAECTAGGVLRCETADGRLIGIVPGRGAAVLVAEAGEAESEADFWRFKVLANAPQAHNAAPAAADAWAVLVAHGLVKAE